MLSFLILIYLIPNSMFRFKFVVQVAINEYSKHNKVQFGRCPIKITQILSVFYRDCKIAFLLLVFFNWVIFARECWMSIFLILRYLILNL